ncbi:DUF4491 domain-containing protein [Clostridiaceae bacterium 14S0207]|nr:DUF4491 domain-containing protein [Clostridiaceae bacterium 14S0207]
MNFQGIFIGFITFIIIGMFHPVVIKGEYYFGKKIWPIFLMLGIVFIGSALFTQSSILSSVLGVTGFSCLWSILEIIEQEDRVKKGWFPSNPKRINKKR